MASTMYDEDLDQNPANHVTLSPISFLVRAARVYPDRIAIIHGARRITYAQMFERCRRLASALAAHGVGRGDTVAVFAPNVPALLEAHTGIPMTGGVICAINTRLDASTIAFILQHSEAKILIVDRELAPVASKALSQMEHPPLVIGIDDALTTAGEILGQEYEDFIAGGDPAFPVSLPGDEWDAISLGYTSGTTGDPKGVVCHHRGAYLNAAGLALATEMSTRSVYLWTLPMFHCNGWTFTWAVTMLGATHVCLRRVDPALIYELIAAHRVTHLCAAPVVLTMLIHAPAEAIRTFDHKAKIFTGGAAPPTPVIAAMEQRGFEVGHVYGLTEVYGPLTVCMWQEGLEEMSLEDRARFLSRQGVPHPLAEDAQVMDAQMNIVPHDAATMGELMLRGNTVMKGYLKNPSATKAAFAGGWFHSGDLGVMHPDSYIEIKDRSKDIIISGGENISSLEVEEVLYKHPLVMEAAVVAEDDEKWGEVPHAFVTLRPGVDAPSEDDIIGFCRVNLARFKVPKRVTFTQLPKTATGKIQKYELRRMLRKSLETPGV
jgi:fatty-acyl-CoA synthase